MKRITHFLIAFCLLQLCACKNGNASSPLSASIRSKHEVVKDTITVFTLPEIPPMLCTPETRAEFLVEHYWDNVNFSDTNYVHHPEVTEQAWADFCNILSHVSLEVAQEGMRKAIRKAEVEKKVFVYITELAEKYLYDPNSPMRNEEFYIPVLEVMADSRVLGKIEKIRPEARLELAQRNRIGKKATNFTYTLPSGEEGTLHQLKTEYVLLFINNPGCHACAETTAQLKDNPTIGRLLKEKKLTVLSVYPDEELEEWRKHLGEFPEEWVNTYDKAQVIRDKQLYDLKAISTLYLLDKSKTVLLKDATVQAIEAYLNDDKRQGAFK